MMSVSKTVRRGFESCISCHLYLPQMTADSAPRKGNDVAIVSHVTVSTIDG